MDSAPNQDQTTPEKPAETPVAEQSVAPAAEPVTPVPVPTPAPAGPPAGPDGPVAASPKRKYTLDIVVAVLLIALIGAALFVVNRYSKPKSDGAATTTKKDIALIRFTSNQPFTPAIYPNIQNEEFELTLNQQVYEGLTGFAERTKIVPQLAVSWSNPDTSTWVFKLRSGVKFHDGTAFTSKQVKASLEQVSAFPIGGPLASTIKSVEAVDPLTVKITTKGPDPLLTNKLAQLWIWNTDSTKKNDASTGTGPYTMTEPATATQIKLMAFDGYWGGHVYTREVDVTSAASNDAELALLKSKSTDLAVFQKTPSAADSVGYKKQTVVQNGTSHIVINSLRKGSPLTKVAVRQALAAATNPLALIAAKGIVSTPITQLIPAGIPGYDPSIKGATYDAAAAKQMLATAGYPTGFSITFTYFVSAQPIAVELQKEYAAVGVTVKLDPESDPSVLGKKAFGGGTDMFYITTSSNLIDSSDIFSDFIGSANYENKDFDALNATAATTIDPAKRVAILQQMSRLFAADQEDIPLYASPNSTLMVGPGIHIMQDNLVSTGLGAYLWKVYSE